MSDLNIAKILPVMYLNIIRKSALFQKYMMHTALGRNNTQRMLGM